MPRPEAAGHQVTREYYFNDFGSQVKNLGASVVAHPRELRRPRRRLPRRVRLRHRRGAVPRRSRGGGREGGRGHRSLGGRPVGVRAGSRRHRGQPRRTSAATSTSGRAEARSTTTAGSSGRSIGCGPPATCTSRTGRSWFRSTEFGDDKDRVVLRSNGEPRPRTSRPTSATCSRSSAAASTGSSTSGARTTTATSRGVQGRGRGDGLRPRPSPDAADRLGPLRARRQGSLDVQARRRVHHPRRAARRDRRRRRTLVLRLARRIERHRLRHRAGEEAVEREPGLLRPVRARPDRSILRKAGEAGLVPPAADDPRLGGLLAGVLAGDPRRAGSPDRPPARGRRGRGRGRRDARHHGLRHGARDARSTPSTATPASSTRTSRTALPPAGPGRRRPARPSPTPWACWGSPRPSRCSSRPPGGDEDGASSPGTRPATWLATRPGDTAAWPRFPISHQARIRQTPARRGTGRVAGRNPTVAVSAFRGSRIVLRSALQDHRRDPRDARWTWPVAQCRREAKSARTGVARSAAAAPPRRPPALAPPQATGPLLSPSCCSR